MAVVFPMPGRPVRKMWRWREKWWTSSILIALWLGTHQPQAGSLAVRLEATLFPDTAVAGGTVAVFVRSEASPVNLTGQWQGGELRFYPLPGAPGSFRALLPIPLITSPSTGWLKITATDSTGRQGVHWLSIPLRTREVAQQVLRLPPSKRELLSPELVESENALIGPVYGDTLSRQLWEGPFLLPTTGRVTARFGLARILRPGVISSRHLGMDIANRAGTQVVAANRGLVVFAGPTRVRGNLVILHHGQGVFSQYLHLDSIQVAVGQTIEKGMAVGTMGSTGRATASHLHWSIRVGGENVDPWEWLILDFDRGPGL